MKMDKAKVENCIAKTRAFYDTKAVGCALLKVKNIATLPSPALSLTDYTFPDDVYKYLDARAQCTIERLAQRAELADDTVPAEGPWYGIAEHTAFLGRPGGLRERYELALRDAGCARRTGKAGNG